VALDVGDRTPDFSTVADDGRPVTSADLKGKTVVFYFYPRADTPGCTTEACGIRDEFGAFQRLGTEVIGVSPDTAEAQAAFKAKYNLPFTLLADPDHQIAEAFGAWGLREIRGQQVLGVRRMTFILGPDGKVQQVFPQVTPADHAQELLQALAPA
jgi:thioredoxin-dependent peroxiredoxin